MTDPPMQALSLTTTSSGSKPSLTLTNFPKPTLPHDSVLVKIHAANINPSDILNANGVFTQTIFPRVPGRDYAGTVIDGPAEYLGQEVYGTSGDTLGFVKDGTHATYCVIACDCLAQKPSNLSFAQAATVGVPFTTAALILRRATLQPSETVLVLGATGAVGSAVCQLARSQGSRVLAAARRDTADLNLASDPELKTARSLTGGKGPDVVVDTTGSPALMDAALMCLAPRGRLAFISAPRKGSTKLTLDMAYVYREEISIVGCNSTLVGMADTAKDLGGMKKGFEDGSLRAKGEKDLQMIGIEDAVGAYEKIGNGQKGGAVIVFQ